MKIFYIILFATALPLYSMQKQPVDQPPAYPQNPFLEALNTENVTEILSQAEVFFTINYLEAWALAAAGTAYEDKGQASFFIAERLFAKAGEQLHRPEILAADKQGSGKDLGQYYLEQACLQNHSAAQELFEQREYRKFPSNGIYKDETLASFKALIRSTKEDESNFLKHAEGLNNLSAGFYAKVKHSLRALAIAMIGLNLYPKSPELNLWLSRFIADRHPSRFYPSLDWPGDIQKVFVPDFQRGKMHVDRGIENMDSPPCTALYLQAELTEAVGNKQEAFRLYRAFMKAPDFETVIPQPARVKDNIKTHISLEDDSCCCVL